MNSDTALNRLIGISNQLSLLNARLQNELLDSRQNSLGLRTMLESSKWELLDLQRELETLRIVSALLLNKAENSQTESIGLLTALKKAEDSLMNLEQSFAAYRQTAAVRITGLEKENRLWKWGSIAAGVLAAGFGTAFFLNR
jgi:predicted  nucleic acid-binding Zn-ribbon protein